MTKSYYNEIDPYAAKWLRNLINNGLIAPGDVDERSIADVQGSELDEYTQCHFFAGIGGWSLALRLAGWPDDRPAWSGSCPCQPFSAAGKRQGTADKRHLWPEFQRIIAQCKPPTVFGEQVASKDGRAWLAGICIDLEAMGYAVGAADLCAAGIGAPHIRQRLFWVADAEHEYEGCGKSRIKGEARCGRYRSAISSNDDGGMEHAKGDGRDERRAEPIRRGVAGRCGEISGLVYAGELGLQRHGGHGDNGNQPGRNDTASDGSVAATGAWADCMVLPYRDPKGGIVYRRSESGAFPLAYGLPRSVGPGSTKPQRMELMAAKANRIGRLKGYGNAIVPEVAEQFIRAWMDI